MQQIIINTVIWFLSISFHYLAKRSWNLLHPKSNWSMLFEHKRLIRQHFPHMSLMSYSAFRSVSTQISSSNKKFGVNSKSKWVINHPLNLSLSVSCANVNFLLFEALRNISALCYGSISSIAHKSTILFFSIYLYYLSQSINGVKIFTEFIIVYNFKICNCINDFIYTSIMIIDKVYYL